MQTILALLEVIKTCAAICASERLEERNKTVANDIMFTCLNMLQKDTLELSLAQNDIPAVPKTGARG